MWSAPVTFDQFKGHAQTSNRDGGSEKRQGGDDGGLV